MVNRAAEMRRRITAEITNSTMVKPGSCFVLEPKNDCMGRSRSLGQFGTENGGDVHHFVQAGLGVTRGTRGRSGRHGYKHLARSQNSSGSRVAYLAHGPCYGEAIERRVVIGFLTSTGTGAVSPAATRKV